MYVCLNYTKSGGSQKYMQENIWGAEIVSLKSGDQNR
jgi:hypothetical protein